MGKIIIPIARLERAREHNSDDVDKLYSIGAIDEDNLVVNRKIYIEHKKTGQHQSPSLMQKASSLGKSMIQWAGNKFIRVDDVVYNKRLSICRGCDSWIEDGNIGFGKCKVCGCGRGKLWLAHEKCPIGKWGIEPLTPPPSV